ncbi:MAG: 4'-phosphopantetheinyl transferase superfamily protein [Sphingomonas sp.]|uniref:4'-phosphopantetheinyl transferase family protein n=1 Tax=Sphingomonas sp. TaxID=28214 RepID=UPI003567D3E1
MEIDLPADARWRMIPVAEGDPAGLMPIEQAHIAAAAEPRRREYAAVRQLARALLSEFGQPPQPIPSLPSRAPQFPPGFVGSLSHGADLALAVMGHERDLLSIGCDIEPREPLPNGVADHVLRPSERAALRDFPAWFDRLVFSAKEAAFKAQHRLSGGFPEFHEIAITLDGKGIEMVAELCVDAGPLLCGTRFAGKACIADRWIATFVWLRA